MNIHEYLGAELLRSVGIQTGRGKVVRNLEDGLQLADELDYPVVIKAQVLTGGRGKAGGVKFAETEEDFKSHFESIKGMNLKGYIVEQLYVVKAAKIDREIYVSLTMDPTRSQLVFIGSSAGGVDIEEVASRAPEKIHKLYCDGKTVPSEKELTSFCEKVFGDPESAKTGVHIFYKLHELYTQRDCTLIEINPLILTDSGEWLAVDAKMNFDDNALSRQPKIQALRDPGMEDADELEAKSVGLSFVKLDGNIGCIVNGAGLAMATMDIVKLSGGSPANFLDVGGSSNPEKMVHAIRIILKNKNVKGLLINIFGGITRCDDIANGFLKALKEIDVNVPFVVRLIGTNEAEAREILKKENIECLTTMREAVEKIISLTK